MDGNPNDLTKLKLQISRVRRKLEEAWETEGKTDAEEIVGPDSKITVIPDGVGVII